MLAAALDPAARAASAACDDRRAPPGAAVPAASRAGARSALVPAIASGLELAGFSILIALSTQLGDDAAHAFQIVFSIHNVTFAVALGLGSAAGVRVGNAVGEGDARGRPSRALIAAGAGGAARPGVLRDRC